MLQRVRNAILTRIDFGRTIWAETPPGIFLTRGRRTLLSQSLEFTIFHTQHYVLKVY